jgi:tRNA threonylcarbamoyladenosine biosynthesis protein TsaE
MQVITGSEEETRAVARRLARRLRPGHIVCLIGPLGAGKTRFVQGLAGGVGYRGRVISPTFTLVREYRGRDLRLYHLDLFRLGPKDLALAGWEDYLSDPQAACVIEWAEVAGKALPADRLEVLFRVLKGNARRITLKATGPLSRGAIKGLNCGPAGVSC